MSDICFCLFGEGGLRKSCVGSVWFGGSGLVLVWMSSASHQSLEDSTSAKSPRRQQDYQLSMVTREILA